MATKTLSTGATITITGRASGRDLADVLVESDYVPDGTSAPERGLLRMLPQPRTVGAVAVVATAGRIGLTADDVTALRAEAAADADRVRALRSAPENVAWRRVEQLYAQAARLRDEPGRYYPTLVEADAARDAWRREYPAAWAEQRRQELLARAQELESQAAGALVYDADGSLSAADQQARHDGLLARAGGLRAQAAGEEAR